MVCMNIFLNQYRKSLHIGDVREKDNKNKIPKQGAAVKLCFTAAPL